MDLKPIIKLAIVLVLVLELCGCVFAYRTIDKATDDRANGILKSDSCEVSYFIKPVLASKADFVSPPYIQDYKSWTEATISGLGCKPKQSSADEVSDIVLTITEVPLPMQYAQAERFLATFTLFLIPIPMEPVGYREYEFKSRDGTTRKVRIVQKGWLGWIFVPLFPVTLSTYAETGAFESQLREFLSGK